MNTQTLSNVPLKTRTRFLPRMCAVLCLMAQPAFASELNESAEARAVSEYVRSGPCARAGDQSSLIPADQCPLLKSTSVSPSSARGSNRHSAGTAAVLGLLFGMRFAVAPSGPVRARQN
jgi:hypothetical protein